MAKVTLDPYLFFQGNCREAMDFYKSVFGGELSLQAFEEAPKEMVADMPGAEEMKGKIMHAALRGDFNLYGADSPKASAQAAKVELCLGGSDEQKLGKYFDALGDGGNVKYPLKKESWGDIFGMLTDKFGVDWMVNITARKE